MNPIMIGVAIVLAISLAGNAGLGFMLRGAWEDKATAEQIAKTNGEAAKTCSNSIGDLELAGKKRQDDVLAAIKANSGQVAALGRKANESMTAKPDDPNDLCGSARRFIKSQIEGGKPK